MGYGLHRRSNSHPSRRVNLKEPKKNSEEIFLTRVAAPFDIHHFPIYRIFIRFPLGFVKKKGGHMLLIHHLFYLEYLSTNDLIDLTAFLEQYSNIDQRALMIGLADKGACSAEN